MDTDKQAKELVEINNFYTQLSTDDQEIVSGGGKHSKPEGKSAKLAKFAKFGRLIPGPVGWGIAAVSGGMAIYDFVKD